MGTPAGARRSARVTRPGGRVVVLELGEPRSGLLARAVRFHIRQVGAALSGAAEYRYLQSSVAAFPAPERFAAMMREAGLEVEEPQALGFGAAWLYVGRMGGSGPLEGPCEPTETTGRNRGLGPPERCGPRVDTPRTDRLPVHTTHLPDGSNHSCLDQPRLSREPETEVGGRVER